VTTKSDFTEEEWSRIVRAPFVAGLAISWPIPAVRSRPRRMLAGAPCRFGEQRQSGTFDRWPLVIDACGPPVP
jgi:hypothetical protein